MCNLTPHLLFVLTLLLTTLATKGDVAAFEPQEAVQFVPADSVEYRPIHSLTSVGVDAGNPPFAECSTCKCCASNNKNDCQMMQCCYRIKCNLPNKPRGTCFLAPDACNCNSCA